MRSVVPSLAALVLGLGALAGCAPTTTYRHTAYVPAVRPIPFDGRTAESQTVRIEGTVSGSSIDENLFPQVGDTALLVPRWTVEGSLMYAATKNVEMGVRGEYAAYEWRQQSAVGTMPLQGAPPSTGVGPELRLTFPLTDSPFALGFAGNLMYATVPFAEWQLGGSTAGTCTGDTCGYTLASSGSEGHIVYSLGFYPSVELGNRGEYGHVFALVGATSGFANDGFTNQPSNASTVSTVGPIGLLGGGYGVSFDWARASALAFWPTTTHGSAVEYGPGVMLTLGVDIAVGTHDRDDRE